jgi:predicted acylesterase/phospholipase RssA
MPGLDIHAGLWLALDEAGCVPTDCSGTSAGALVSAAHASGRSAENFVAILRDLSDTDVRKERFAWKLRIPWIDYFLESAPIRKILNDIVVPRFEDLNCGLHCWTTDISSGQSVNVAFADMSESPAAAALASMSICGVFEAVTLLDGRQYVDGGVRKNLPLLANWRDYDRVILCIASEKPRDYQRQHGILTHLLRNVHFLMLDQVEDVLDVVSDKGVIDPRVTVLWPDCHAPAGTLHFDHSLITTAYIYAKSVLQGRFSC